jgi:hypothetical protein
VRSDPRSPSEKSRIGTIVSASIRSGDPLNGNANLNLLAREPGGSARRVQRTHCRCFGWRDAVSAAHAVCKYVFKPPSHAIWILVGPSRASFRSLPLPEKPRQSVRPRGTTSQLILVWVGCVTVSGHCHSKRESNVGFHSQRDTGRPELCHRHGILGLGLAVRRGRAHRVVELAEYARGREPLNTVGQEPHLRWKAHRKTASKLVEFLAPWWRIVGPSSNNRERIATVLLAVAKAMYWKAL